MHNCLHESVRFYRVSTVFSVFQNCNALYICRCPTEEFHIHGCALRDVLTKESNSHLLYV